MAIEVFKRYESKFMLDNKAYNNILLALNKYMYVDEYTEKYGYYTISNIYYDTYDNNLIRESVSKPKYKEKIRLRAYGVPGINSEVYLEIKKKFNGIVNKRRTVLKLNEAYKFLKTASIPEYKPYMNKQVLNELEYTINLYNIIPAVYIAYDRKAFFGKDDKNFRLTIDNNIRTRRYDLKLEKGDYGTQLLKPNQKLMEIKTEGSIPIWLTDILCENKIYKTSFSKYGTEYSYMLADNIENSNGGLIFYA